MATTPKLYLRSIALEAGLIDPDLSARGQMVTDYGSAEEPIIRFAALVAERAADEVFRAEMRALVATLPLRD